MVVTLAARRGVRAVELAADGGESVDCFVELGRDQALDVVLKWGSGRRMSSRSTGSRDRYLPARPGKLGPVVWNRPTALSVMSNILITRAHGLPPRLSATWSRYCSCL
jgi:hypothetical protein